MTNLNNYQTEMKEVAAKYMNGQISFAEFKKLTKNVYVEAEPLFRTHLTEAEFVGEPETVNNPVAQH